MTSIPQYTNQEELKLLSLFQSSGGIISSKCAISHFAGMGRGFTARQDVQSDELLFSIPRHLLLNINTSQLSSICKDADQDLISNTSNNSDVMMIDIQQNPNGKHKEKESPLTWELIKRKGGWAALILSIMWENWRVSENGRKDWEGINANRMEPWTTESKEDADGDGMDEHKNARFREIERPKGNQEWGAYLDILPKSYDTPMFWELKELKELEGTNVIDKVGRSEMDQTYYDLVLPYVESRPSIFFGSSSSNSNSIHEIVREFYSLEMYHRMGSAILSRSFHVEKPGSEEEEEEEEEADDTVENENEVEQGDQSKEVEGETKGEGEGEVEGEEDGDDSDDEEDPDQEQLEDISLVPMADLLNAKYESDNVSTPRAAGLNMFGGNPSRAVLELHRAERLGGEAGRARLFYKALTLEMRATKPIKAGEQIFNTYGNPPNSDLLRRYSHVDEPNGNDIVELTASNLVQGAVNCLLSSTNQDERELKSQALKTILSERLEWACEFSLLDDTFILTYPFPPSIQEPYLTGSETEGKLSNKDFRRACKIDSEKEKGNLSSELIIASRFLLMSKESFKKFQKKQSLPKAEIDSIESVDEKERDISIAELICEAIKDRSKKYETELEFDEERLYGNERLMVKDEKDEKVRKALVVRVGEKRILRDNCLLFGFVKREVDKEIEKREKKKSGSKKRGGGKEEGGGKRRKA